MRWLIALLVLLGSLLVPTAALAQDVRILEPEEGTIVRPGQTVRMRGEGCPPGGQVWFEDGTAMNASADGTFATSFEIPPGPPNFKLEAVCGGVEARVRLVRSSRQVTVVPEGGVPTGGGGMAADVPGPGTAVVVALASLLAVAGVALAAPWQRLRRRERTC
jgi:hypothetical protein